MTSARTALGSLVGLLAASSAQSSDAIAVCSPIPAVLHFSQPVYPANVESRGLPSPVSVTLEFTVSEEGRTSNALVVDSDAGTYAQQFGEQAIQAVATWRFHRVPKACRGRAKVVFKIAD